MGKFIRKQPLRPFLVPSASDVVTDSTDSTAAKHYEPQLTQRSFDAVNGRLLGLARMVYGAADTFFYLTYKSGGSPVKASGTTSLTSGYTTSPEGVLQVLASNVSDRVYMLFAVNDGTDQEVAIYKIDR